MNAESRLNLRTKLVLVLAAVGLICVVGLTAISMEVGEPKIEVTFSGYETNRQFVSAVMTVRNVGSAPGMILGYGETNAVLEFAYEDESGAWQPRIRTCGTGLAYHMILPGQQLQSREPMFEKARWRSGIIYRHISWFDRLPKKLQERISYYPQPRSGTAWSLDFDAPPAVSGDPGLLLKSLNSEQSAADADQKS